jgi:hypothetical protein
MKNIRKNSAGYAVLELLFYVSFFLALSLAVISAMVTMSRIFRETSLYTAISRSSYILERISREVRSAEDITAISVNSLKLNSRDELGNLKTVEFVSSGGDLRLLENDILVGNLNAPGTTVSELSFIQISTAESKAVKIYFTVSSDKDTLGRAFEFYDTIVLRGNY